MKMCRGQTPRHSIFGQNLEVTTSPGPGKPQAATWSDSDRVDHYLARIGGLAPRAAGEEVLLSVLPESPRSVLDLGCGDGRLAALILEHRPSVERVLALDSSPAMLGYARDRFDSDPRVHVREWSLDDPLTPLGSFDTVVAGFSIHHVEDHRKRDLFREVAEQLNDDGVFANLEVVASATPELHRQFLDLIGRAGACQPF